MSQKIYIYDTQWQALLSAIGQGDTSALITALNDIAAAIQNQTLTLDFSNLNSDAVLNLSSVTGDNISDALDLLKTNYTNLDNSKLPKRFYSPIFATSSDYGRHITNGLYINISDRTGSENTGGYSIYSDSNVPSDMSFGIRDVVWYNQDIVFVRYFGLTTSDQYAYWCNVYSGYTSVWLGWKKLIFT